MRRQAPIAGQQAASARALTARAAEHPRRCVAEPPWQNVGTASRMRAAITLPPLCIG